MGAGSDDHSGFSEGWTFPGSGSPRQEKNECAGSSQPPVGDGSAESLCAGGNCDFRKLDFDRGISVGVVCRRRERKAGDDWGCLDSGFERPLDAYAFFTRFGQEKTEVSIMSRNISYREMRRSGKILKRTVNELLAVREAVNLAALYADSEKRSEAEALALAITGLPGITPITAAASFHRDSLRVCRIGGR